MEHEIIVEFVEHGALTNSKTNRKVKVIGNVKLFCYYIFCVMMFYSMET